MRKIFDELVTGFSSRTGCPCTLAEGTCQATITVEELPVQVGLLEASGMLILQTGLTGLPDKNREEFLLALLTANNLYSGTGGLCIGVDAEQELVTLQLAWEIEHLNAERFDNLMAHMLNGVVLIMELLMAWEPQAEQVGASQSAPSGADTSTNFLKA